MTNLDKTVRSGDKKPGRGRKKAEEPAAETGYVSPPSAVSDEEIKVKQAFYERQKRSDLERESKSRDTQFRESEIMESRSRFHVDAASIPDGYVVGWVVTDLLGKPEPDALDKAFDRGWEPMLRSNHAEILNDRRQSTLESVFGNAMRQDAYIRRGGQILCMRKVQQQNREEAEYKRKNIENKRLASMNDGILFKDVDSVTYGPLESGGFKQSRFDQ